MVDASGPFQDYGKARYAVVEACIAARVDDLDFADSAEFVDGIAALGAAARAASVFALAGGQQLPGSDRSGLARAGEGYDHRARRGGIAPSPHAGIGLNVMHAVVGFAGAPVHLRRVIAALFGFPHADDAVPVRIAFAPEGPGERWTRTFGRSSFHSLQEPGRGRNRHLLVERYGPVGVALALEVVGDRLRLVPRNWSILGVPLPSAFLPAPTSFESEENGQFRFDLDTLLPLIGRIVAFRGSLAPD